jgi:PAS domain S-box-containing protein
MMTVILIASLVLQLVAVYFALRLIKITGRTLAWSLIAAAISLMALRRGISLEQTLGADVAKQPDLFVELVALAISALMAFGIERITPIFREARATTEQLKDSEAKYRRFVDTANEGIWALDTELHTSFVNAQMETLLGYSLEEMMGHPLADFLFPEDLDDNLKHMALRQQGTSEHYLRRFRRKDGGELWAMVSATALHDEAGSFTGSFAMLTNITERKRVEEELRHRESYAHSLLRLSRHLEQAQSYAEVIAVAEEEVARVLGYHYVGVYLLNDDQTCFNVLAKGGSLSDAIDQFSATLPIAGDPMLEEIALAQDIVLVEDARTDPRTNKDIVEKMALRTLVNVPIFLSERHIGTVCTGSVGDEGVMVPTLSEQGYLTAMVSHMAVTLDRIQLLAELKRLNRELRAMSVCNQAMVRAEDEMGLLKEVCQTLCDDVGYLLAWVGYAEDDADKSIRPVAWAGNGSDYISEAKLSWSEVLPQGRGPAGMVVRSGKTIYVQDFEADQQMTPWRSAALSHGYHSGIALPLKDDDGKTFAVLLIYSGQKNAINEKEVWLMEELANDLAYGIRTLRVRAENARAEEALRRYRDELEETVEQRTTELVLARDAAEAANKAKSLFLANMSHELRTPLNAILGFSSMMRQDPQITESQRVNINIINRSGEHLLKLINDVLEIAKIESGRLQLEETAFDLGETVRDVSEMMQLRAQEKGLQLLVDQTSEFPRYIRGDEARVRQILVNLVGNAVKFTDQGGVTIRLGVRNNARAHLLIEVEDSGPGISAEDQKRIFEPFVQLAEGLEHGGSGLGLSITRQFVQLMGGHIELESEPGKGALFRVDLPLELAQSADIMHMAGGQHGKVIGLAAGQPAYRILVVEDQYENQLLLKRLMTDLGLETRVAENGEVCLKCFEEWHPDLIWMDRRMPVMDGVEAARRIRQMPGGDKVKIVAVTASVFKEQQPEMLAAGMDDFVRKPYRFGEIYECMERQLGAQFIYQDMVPTDNDTQALAPGALADLSAELKAELRTALETLDSQRVSEAIEKVRAKDKAMARSLARLADNFDYPAILAALDERGSA